MMAVRRVVRLQVPVPDLVVPSGTIPGTRVEVAGILEVVATWENLKRRLERLNEDPSRPLCGYPDPRVDEGRQPPFAIRLAPWAIDVARNLYDSFGDDVDLTVGYLHYPGAVPPASLGWLIAKRPPVVDPSHVGVDLSGDVAVVSGHQERGELQVENRSSAPIEIRTNGHLTAMVVDPQTDEIVGSFAGAQRLPLIRFDIRPGAARTLPLLVGTASLAPRLGYAVPEGRWEMEAWLDLGDQTRRTRPLPLTVLGR